MSNKNLLRNFLFVSLPLVAVSFDASAYITHNVQRNETLWGIAHKYKVSPESIVALNPDAANGLKSGMIIRVPESDAEVAELLKDSQPAASSPTSDKVVPNTEETATLKDEIKEITNPKNNIELPIITSEHNSEPGNTYTARYGDTFSSISRKTNVSVTELMAYNPLLNGDKLSEGEVVRLTKDAPYQTNKLNLNVVDSVVYRISPNVANKDTRASADKSVAIMLPFDISHDELSRQTMLATDFYKGFLMAIQENSKNINYNLRVFAIDTKCDDAALLQNLETLAEEGVNVIIPPDDDSQIATINKFANEHGITVLNVLNIKDEGYVDNSNVVQCNISQKLMYDKAINALLTYYEDYTPVILDPAGAKDEKLSFIEELRKKYDSLGRKVIDLSFSENLQMSDLDKLSPGTKYIFIPKSGAHDVFERFDDNLALFIESDADTDRLKLFGYPDWVAFRGESLDNLHRTGATIYSRFYYNPEDDDTIKMDEDFSRWYGSKQIDVFPSQGTLGYDTGNLLLRMIANKWMENSFNRQNIGSFNGLQSAFTLTRNPSNAGIINDSLYLIDFMPGGFTYTKVI